MAKQINLNGYVFKEMLGKRLIHGVPTIEAIGKPLEYFNLRNIFLDCRGPLKIDPTSEWGWFVTVITLSHDISSGQWTVGAVHRPVTVDKHAWICSNALLYNCHIGHHAVVACGAVVRNMTVEPYTIVEGNPAVATRRFVDGKWINISLPSEVVYTTGAFDLLHVGHLNRLRDARSLGDKLIVGIMSDEFIRRSKKREPVIPERDRAELLMALSCVDEVTIVPDHTADHDFLTRRGVTIRVVGPEYGWAGGHQRALLYMEEHNIKVIKTSRMPGISTTEIMRKIRE